MCLACAEDLAAALECPERLSDYLHCSYLFRDLTGGQVAEVVTSTRTESLTDGHWLYRQGDAAKRFFIVREGKIALFRQSAEGRECIIAILGPDEVFGEELIFLPVAEHDLNARAVGETTLLSIDRELVRSFLPTSPALVRRLMSTLYRRQQMLLDHIERLTLQDATQRLMAYLLAQVREETGSHRLELALPKSTLAAHLSIQPETLSRILTRLKECDYLSEEGDALIVRVESLRSGLSCTLCDLRWGCPGPEKLLQPLAEGGPRPSALL